MALLGSTSASAQNFPPYLPQRYQSFLKHFVDGRGLSETMLNIAGLSLKEYGRGFALIAGVSKYPRITGPAGNLEPAAEDVRKLVNYLKTYEKMDEIVVLTNEDMTQENLSFFLEKYFPRRLRENPGSRFLFAYSGHGVTEKNRGYLLSSEARSLDDTFNSISMTTLRAMFQSVIDSGFHVLALINACYSGDFLRLSFGNARFIPKWPGAHAITAGGTKELTWHDGSVGTGSVFFESLFTALDGRAGNEQVVTVDELVAYLKRQVQGFTDQQQNPLAGDLKVGGSAGGFFFFNRSSLVQQRILPPWDGTKGVPFGGSVLSKQAGVLSTAELISRGNTYFDLKDFEGAITDYSEALKRDPTNINVLIGRGRSYQQMQDDTAAISDFTEAIKLEPTNADAYYRRGQSLENVGIDKKNKAAYDRSLADFNRAVRLAPTNIEFLRSQGFAFFRRQDYDTAIAIFSEAIRIDPKSAAAFSNRGSVYDSKKDYTRALADLNKAIQLDPKNSNTFNNRGSLYRSMGDNKRAIAEYSEAIRLSPTFAVAYANRSLAYKAIGDIRRSVADMDEARRIDASFYNNRGKNYSARGDLARAIADFDEAIRRDPKSAIAWFNRGRAKQRSGDRSGGAADITKAKQLDPEIND